MDNPVYCSSYMDELNRPLYPFGFGLSYTTFSFSDFRVSSRTLCPGESITVSVEVENTGSYDGEEVVQLYVRDYYASLVRPVKELKGYQKIFLKSGEKRCVEFVVTEEQLKFYDVHGNYTAEAGKFALMVGNSSENVKSVDVVFNK